MVENDHHLRHRHHHGWAEVPNTPRTHLQHHSSSSQHTGQHEHHSEHLPTAQQHTTEFLAATCSGRNEASSSQRPPLQSSLRWLQLCLLLLFAQDVFCFSLGYPFLPQYLAEHGHGGPGVALAFGIYGVASIATLLLLLLVQSSSRSSSSVAQQPAAKYWLILTSTSLAAVAGAVNTVIPDSYAVLLATKAVQGAASALYFVYTLGLVAKVFPAVYKTQAMAFVSAGLTLGDAFGPVVGGIVYQSRSLQDALGMQPAASGLALVALLMLVLAWPNRKRPWSLARHHYHQQQQQQQRHHIRCFGHHNQQESSGQCQQHWKDVEHSATYLQTPLLQDHGSGLSLGTVTTADNSCSTDHRSGSAAATCSSGHKTVTTTPAEGAAAAETTVAKSSLLQLLSSGGILSLCMLALMCQAARTAVDLLLPLMLQDSVQPGVIGLLFAGEAVGSVITPFCVDWLMHRRTRHSSSNQQQQQQQQQSGLDWGGVANATAANSGEEQSSIHVADDASCDQQNAFSSTAEHRSQHSLQSHGTTSMCNEPASSNDDTTMAANKLLFVSAVGMAVCCCLVLTVWELPAASCHLLQHLSSSSSSGGGGGGSSGPDWQLQAWLCPHAHTYGTAATAALAAAVGGVAAGSSTSSSSRISNSGSTIGIQPQLQEHGIVRGLWLGCRGSSSSWQLNVCSSSSRSGPDRNRAAAGAGHNTAGPVLHTGAAATAAAAAAAAAASVTHASLAFGLLQLLLTGLGLMVLGGCHSSCETLIYTVLTDLVSASRQAGDSSATREKAQNAAAPSAAGVASSSTEVRRCPGLKPEHRDVLQSRLKQCPQGGATTSDSCHMTTDCSCAHCATQFLSASQCSGPDVSGVDDATEVVMVLYVLFWVVGFTAGASVAGIPGSSLLGQQLTACSTGLVLGVVAWWSWSKAAAVFVQQQQQQY